MYLLGESLVLINPGFSQLYGGATNLGPNTKAGPHGQYLACTIFQRGGGGYPGCPCLKRVAILHLFTSQQINLQYVLQLTNTTKEQ